MASDTDAASTRTLILLRHAKSDWPDVPDHDRPLAKRGRKDAPVVGRWLHDHGYVPDTVVCSTARRTRQTWELIAPELDGSPSVHFEPRAYGASSLTLLYLARELPGRCRVALLIGHNPGIEDLANSLAAPPGEGAAPLGEFAAPPGEGAALPGEGAAPPGEFAAPPGEGVAPRSPGLRFPTAGVAVFEFTGDWPSLAPGHAHLLEATTPADLKA